MVPHAQPGCSRSRPPGASVVCAAVSWAIGADEAARREDELAMAARMLMVKISLAATTNRLDLTDCRLTELPAEVCDLTELEDLSLAGNCLSELPEGIGRLTALKRLGLAGNRLTSVPESIGALTQLEGLWLHGNLLESVPHSLGALTSLKQLSLSGNRLTQLPDVFSGLAQLVEFGASGNALTEVPPSLGCLPSLRKLSLNGNELRALPATLGGLTALQELWLQGNALESLHPSLCDLTALKELSVADNKLTSLPEGISGLSSLHKFWAFGNDITHAPAAELAQLPALASCWVEGNPLDASTVGGLLRAAGPHGSQGAAPSLRALGLDTAQLSLAEPNLVRAAKGRVKVGEVRGPPGPGYFKLSPSPNTHCVCPDTGALLLEHDGSLPRQEVLVVALGSAPGTPNWGGLLGRLYREAGDRKEERAFDVLYVVDPARQWYGNNEQDGAGAMPDSAASASLQYYYDRLEQYTRQYKHVIMMGDSMGATAALLFAPLATHVLAFCPQVDLSTSCMRPGCSDGALAGLRERVLGAVGRARGRVVAYCGTWQHDLDQANLLPGAKVTHKVFSLDSHRLTVHLDRQGKLLPLVQEAVRAALGIRGSNVRTANLL